ncbi:MAG: methylated-DNA--[protein]-cysteine S-methyltransferase [Coriobacteriia bacterium]|nr:methylated-DNA--[protein]-cysteine S-methyltransferase [Coriobacteriia bacterium]
MADEDAVTAAATYLEAHAAETVTLERLAGEVGLSASHLQRAFTARFGLSPKQYQTALRVEALKSGLRDGADISTAAYDAGFGSSRGAYEATRKRTGMSPDAYRRRGAGLSIRYGIESSPLGLVLVGITDAGVCAIMLADDEATLISGLEAEFGAAGLMRDDDAVRDETAAVLAYLEGRTGLPDLPLDLHGTEFQRRVWSALRLIPAGRTITYGELAKNIGRPTAQRAVASACGDNHVALLVPCHRVVRTDGGLGGYKWGVHRKERLLAVERKA